jgi:hypothetical protein
VIIRRLPMTQHIEISLLFTEREAMDFVAVTRDAFETLGLSVLSDKWADATLSEGFSQNTSMLGASVLFSDLTSHTMLQSTSSAHQ